MAYQIGAMEIVLRTDLQQFTSGMRNAEQAVSQSSARMSRATEGATRSVGGLERALGNIHGADSFRALTISALRAEDSLSRLKSVALLIPSALGGVSVALGSRALIDYADTMTTIRNRISVVVDGQKERIRTEQEVFAIAQRTRSQFSATANLYARTTQAAENLGRSQADVLRFTEAVQKTNLISGSTTQESAAGAIQLAQGLASGRLQGDELRSILENNLELANILARELAGGDKGRLRELGSEGQLTANAVIDAVLRNLDRIDKKFAQSQPTIAQGFVLIDNAITKYVGDLDQALGATAAFVKILTSLSNSIPEAASALAGLGAVAASIFAGKIVSAAGSGISGAFTGAKTEVRQQGVAAFQAAIAAQRAREEANLRVVGAAEKVREGKASIFAAADPDAVRSFSAASEAMQRANSKLDAAVSERDRVAQQLDRINRQIAGAERQLSQAINSEAPQNARGLRSYFKAAFEVDAAKARAEAAAQAIVDAKQTRSDTMVGLSKTFLVGDPREQAKLETAMSRMDNLVAARERARIDAVNAIADAEKRAADEAARAVGAAEAAKSRAVQDALNQRRALIQQQAQAQAALESAGTRVSAASISQSFAQSALSRATGDVEGSAAANLSSRVAEYNAATVRAAEASAKSVAAQTALQDAYKRTGAAINALPDGSLRPLDLALARVSQSMTIAGTAALRLGRSFLDFIGGPWGLAFTGLSAALGILAYRQVEAANTATRHKQALDELPASIERVNAALRAAQTSGADPSRVLVDEKARLEQAQQAAKGQTQAFFNSLQQIAGTNAAALAQILRDAFNVQAPRGTSVLGLLDEVQRMGPPTIAQIQQVERAVQTLSLNNGLNPKVAGEILKAGEEARRTQGLVDSLSRAVANLDGARAKITIEMNVAGSFLNPQDVTRPSLRQIENEIMGKVSTEDQINKIREEGTTIADRRRASEARLRAEYEKRQAYAALPKKIREAEELRDQYPFLTLDQALAQKAREEAQSKQGKKAGGGKSSEERFDDRVKLLEAQGRAAFLNDRYRELIDQLKTLKSDPSLAEETLKAIEAGTALPERAAKILAARDKKKAGELAKEFKDQYGSMADAIDKVAERQRLLNIAVQEGRLTPDQAAIALVKFKETLPQFSFLTQTSDAVGGIAKQFGLAAAGMQSFDQALQNIKSSLINLFLDELLVKPIRELVSNNLGGVGGGGGGILNLLFSSFLPVPGAVFHAGGTVGGPSAMRLAPASLWNGAPRHHMGLNAGEHRAILKHGERVLTENDARRTDATMLGLARRARNDNAAGGAAGINVEIINNGGQVRTEPFRGDDGRQGLRVMFDTMFDERVSSGGADRVMGNRFGASPSRVRR